MPQNPKAIIKVDCPHRVNSPTPYVPPPVSTHAVQRSKNCKLEMEIEMSKERVEWKWEGGRETKRNETTKCSYHRKSFVATYIARTMRPSGQVEKRKAASCDCNWTVLYMAELKLDWTGLELYVTLHWAIGNSFFFSRSRRGQTAIVVTLMHPRVDREGVGVSEAAAFTSSDGDCPRGLPFRRT